jgi:hypothetical protein
MMHDLRVDGQVERFGVVHAKVLAGGGHRPPLQFFLRSDLLGFGRRNSGSGQQAMDKWMGGLLDCWGGKNVSGGVQAMDYWMFGLLGSGRVPI